MDGREMLVEGIHAQHDGAARVALLNEVWQRREEVAAWCDEEFGELFQPGTLPVFLHGGSARGKILVMGINPGEASKAEIEFTQAGDGEGYRRFHGEFYAPDVFPRICSEAKTAGLISKDPPAFWTSVGLVVHFLTTGKNLVASGAAARWQQLGASVVAQDVIPFHSKAADGLTRRFVGEMDGPRGALLPAMAEAAIDGLAASGATLVLGCAPQLYFAAIHARDDLRQERLMLPAKNGSFAFDILYGRIGAVPAIFTRNAAFSACNLKKDVIAGALSSVAKEQLGVDPRAPAPLAGTVRYRSDEDLLAPTGEPWPGERTELT